ncbi:MAG: tape measure protein, partial [Halothiobacillaceae bacterium]
MSDLNVDLKIRATIEGVDDIQSVEEALRGVGDAAAPAADAQGEAAASARALGDEAGNAAIGLDDMRAALAAVASVAILRDLVDTAAAFEAMEKGLEALSGSSESARAEMAYVAQTADRLGVGVRDAAQSYVSLSAATKGTALEGQNTRAIFESVAGAMSKLGKSGAETQQALAAIGQMASKGTVSMEELRGQLGEALPGAMQAAARAMGVTVAELDAMVSSGRVAADDLLPKLAAELTKTFGTEPPDTINSALARLQNKLDLAYKTFGETGSMEAFKTALSGVGTALEAVAITASGAWEAVELAGNGLGALAAALAQAASGDVAGAWESLKTNIAEAADQAASDIVHVADAVTGAGEAVAATASVFQAPTLAAERLAASLGTVGQEGGASADAIAKLFKQLDLTTPDGVTALVDAFTLLGEGTRDADKALTDYTATMSAADLSAFRAQIEAVYQGGQVDAARFAQVNDQILAASFQRLGLTAETALGRISPAAGEAIASLDGIRSAVANTADSGAAKMQALEQAVGAALGKADTLAAVEALRGRIEAMGQAGELSAAGMQRLNDQMGDQARKIEQSIPGIQSMAEAYKQLGITAMSEMQKAADANLAAFEALKAGKAPLADLQAGFMAYAASAIRANSGVADSALLAQAGVLGLRDEVVRIEADAIQSSEAMHRVEASYKASADAAQRQAQAIQQSAAANVAATKAALEAAKARGDEVEIARAAIQLAQAEAQAARDVAAAKQIEADAAWMKVEAVKVELMQDGLLTEADMQVVEASKQVAEGKQAEADAALDAAAAKG